MARPILTPGSRRRKIRLFIDPASPLSMIQVTIILLDLVAAYFDRRGRGDVAHSVARCAAEIRRGWVDLHTF